GNRNDRNGNGGNNNGCTNKEFLACKPIDFDGKGGVIVLTRWIKKMESARGHEAALGMTWKEFKALLVVEFCPSNKIEKLETEFYNHDMVGANPSTYTDRFHELAKLVPHLAGALTDKAVRYGTSSKSSEKRKEVLKSSKQEGSWNENKREKVGKGFVAAGPPRNQYTSFILGMGSDLLTILKVDLEGCATIVRNQVTLQDIVVRQLGKWRY
nr:reverse transcriptase domain-containing protein [Tanacetum cinerariifolium]